MRKFWTLMKTLTAFRSFFVRKPIQPTTLSVAYCNPAWDCCSSSITTPITDTFHHTQDDADGSGSFFLQPDAEDHSQLLTLITSEIEHIQRRQRKDDDHAPNIVPLYERISYATQAALVINLHALVPATVPVKSMLHPFNHFFSNLLFTMKHLFRRKSLYCLAIIIAGICIANKVQAQTNVTTFDYSGSYSSGGCSSDHTYSSGISGSETATVSGISGGAVINSISLTVNFGRTNSGSTTVAFYLNGNFIGTVSGSGLCNNFTISSIDPSYLVSEGGNTISYTGSTSRTAVFNAILTVNYTVCTPPPAPDVPEDGVKLCLDATASALTATGDNLLWYTAPDDPTGSPDAPVPSTDNTGTTAYYVTQTVGCESDKAEIDVTVNPLPTSSVAGLSNISCFGASDGSITVQGNDGSGSYVYSIDDGASWTATFTSDAYTFMGLSAQQYKIRVKDSNGCISKTVQ